jgi:hypothetical protein
MKLTKNTTIIIAVAILIVGVLAYVFVFGKKKDDTLTTTGGPTSDAQATFLDLASQIDLVTFDTSIFSDPRFMSLVDISVAVIPEAQGRSDPFSP